MLAHLDLQETSVVGASIPGIPIIFSGKNNQLAWGSSFSFVDDQDLYFEKINSVNKDEYLSPSGYKHFYKQNAQIALCLKWTGVEFHRLKWNPDRMLSWSIRYFKISHNLSRGQEPICPFHSPNSPMYQLLGIPWKMWFYTRLVIMWLGMGN